ncbi:hypothetical protein [Chitinophaga sp. CF118]|uniref:hypothetical protein n=1 Tax=Chitinophaga sp. CF118 TaxID=1884367 RepID=UPI000B7DC92A|nr:hypothetical protein [Chitinophaga sp. CF118]
MKVLPQPDTTVIKSSYSLITAVSTISPESGTSYKIALVQYASFFKFDRSVAYGDLYYEAILESQKHFIPLKFFIQNNGSGQITAVATASEAEIATFRKAWQK